MQKHSVVAFRFTLYMIKCCVCIATDKQLSSVQTGSANW